MLEADTNAPVATPKKRDRRAKLVAACETTYPLNVDVDDRRGRKPRGGKLVRPIQDAHEISNKTHNIILHLKCKMEDLTEFTRGDPHSYDPSPPPEIRSYDPHSLDRAKYSCVADGVIEPGISAYPVAAEAAPTTEPLDIPTKLLQLKHVFINAGDKRSACFWCTYDYDTPEIHILKHNSVGAMQGYGSFCRPECACAFLMKENIDDSIKFERYQLLNYVYGPAYGYTSNIKPAPDPYYMLSKFYGSFSIDEYRDVVQSGRKIITVVPPITRTFPEVHEETDAFILNAFGYAPPPTTSTGAMQESSRGGRNYRVKRASDNNAARSISKNNIIKANFGV
jgi:hypothetical protein